MSKKPVKIFELSQESVKKLKLMAGITPGGYIKRNIHIVNGSDSSLIMKTTLKDVPDDCKISTSSFSSMLGIFNMLKKGICIDYTDFNLENHLSFKIFEKDNEKVSFTYVAADESHIENVLKSELPEDQDFDLEEMKSNEFELSSDMIKFILSAGNNIDANVIKFTPDNNIMKIELFNTDSSNSHRFNQELDKNVTIETDLEFVIDFELLKLIDSSNDYSIKYYEDALCVFTCKTDNMSFAITPKKMF